MKTYKFKATITVPAGTRILVDGISYNTTRPFVFEGADIVSTVPQSVPDFSKIVLVPKSSTSNLKIGNTSYKLGKRLTKSFNPRHTDTNHITQRRTPDGKFIKKDTIAEFDYPHSSNGLDQFRRVKVIKNTEDYIEGIQVNSGNTGFKRFKKSKASGLVQYKGYLD